MLSVPLELDHLISYGGRNLLSIAILAIVGHKLSFGVNKVHNDRMIHLGRQVT